MVALRLRKKETLSAAFHIPYPYNINTQLTPPDLLYSIMDKTRLSHLLENTYIPSKPRNSPAQVPPYHPCLIVQDKQTDVTKLKPCGCADSYCVKNAPEWIPTPKH